MKNFDQKIVEPQAATTAKKERVYEIDALRFCAAMSVLMYHYVMGTGLFPWMSQIWRYGFLGVNLFFMISGFVIMLSAYDSKPSDFAISRIARLYPTYWVAVTLTIIVVLFMGGDTHGVTVHQYLANLSMINNYFKIEDVDGVYWTLQTELKFYFWIFVLIAVKYIKKIHIWLTVWLLWVILYRFFKQPFFLGWVITPFYSSYFIAGIAFFLIRTEGLRLYSLMVILSALSISISYNFSQVQGFIKNATGIDQIVTTVLILSIYGLFLLISLRKIKLNDSKLLFNLGALTYPLYLIHSRIGNLLFEWGHAQANRYFLFGGITLMMLAVSFFVYYYIERKMIILLKEFCFSVKNSWLKGLSYYLN